MNPKQLYQTATNRLRSNILMRLLRRFSFFSNKPFYRELLNANRKHENRLLKMSGDLSKKLDAKATNFANKLTAMDSRLHKFDEKIQHVSNDHQSQFKDFDAVLNRLNFIEQHLHTFNSDLQKCNSGISEVHNLLGPPAKLLLGGRIKSLELPGSSLLINHGRYGNFILRAPDVVGDSIRAGEFWDSHLHDLIIRYSDMDGIAVDAGAYVGFHSCFMARYFSKVVSFEPQAPIFRMLAANLLLNNVENVEIHNLALYDRECFMRIASQEKQEIPIHLTNGRFDYSDLSNAGALTFEVSDCSPDSVKSFPLDHFNLENVRFIKVDTQGSDLNVLLGAKETIIRCRPVIVFEFEVVLSGNHGATRRDYESFFESLDYKIHLIRSQEDKQFDFLAVPN